MIICDMHVHSQSSHDSNSSVVDCAIACIENGISAFAVTDHCDIEYFMEHNVPTCMKASFEETKKASEQFEGKVKILRGIELGEAIWSKEYTDRILGSFDFDVVIGSVHAVRYKEHSMPYSVIDFSKFTATELDEYMETYFNEVIEMLNNVSFDVMAHLTCPLRYINGKYGLGIRLEKYKDKIIKILKLAIERSVSLEINTSGIGAQYGALMPDAWIIKCFKEMGGYLITLGSDAHVPDKIGNGFDTAISVLKKYGFDGYYYYENRKPIFCKM